MKRTAAWLVAAVAILSPGAARADKKPKGVMQAQRTQWVMGILAGQEKNGFYPFVLKVDPESEAQRRGIKAGDEIVRVDNDEVRSLSQFYDRIDRAGSGRTVTLWVRRGATPLRFSVSIPKNWKATPASEAEAEPQVAGARKSGDEPPVAAEPKEEDKKKKKKKKPAVVIKPLPSDSNR
jgi:S1-C subfamily serine protease